MCPLLVPDGQRNGPIADPPWDHYAPRNGPIMFHIGSIAGFAMGPEAGHSGLKQGALKPVPGFPNVLNRLHFERASEYESESKCDTSFVAFLGSRQQQRRPQHQHPLQN